MEGEEKAEFVLSGVLLMSLTLFLNVSLTLIAVLMETLCLSWTLNPLRHPSPAQLLTSQLEMVCSSSTATFLPNSSMTRRACTHFWNSSGSTASRER